MPEYQDVLTTASQLSVNDRLRLIDDLAGRQFLTTSHLTFQRNGWPRFVDGVKRSIRGLSRPKAEHSSAIGATDRTALLELPDGNILVRSNMGRVSISR